MSLYLGREGSSSWQRPAMTYNLQVVHNAQVARSASHSENCQHAWHRMFGHRDPEAVGGLDKKNLATGIKILNCGGKAVCERCLEGKFSRLPFQKKSKKKTKQPLDLVHTDLCGPMNTRTPGFVVKRAFDSSLPRAIRRSRTEYRKRKTSH